MYLVLSSIRVSVDTYTANNCFLSRLSKLNVPDVYKLTQASKLHTIIHDIQIGT